MSDHVGRHKIFVVAAAAVYGLALFVIAGAHDVPGYLMGMALPFSLAPAIAPGILDLGGGSYGVLFTVAGTCGIAGTASVIPIKAFADHPARCSVQLRSW